MNDPEASLKTGREPDAPIQIRLHLTRHPMLAQAILETPLGDRADRLIGLATMGLIAERSSSALHGTSLVPASLPQMVTQPQTIGPSGDMPAPRLSKNFTENLLEQLDE